MSQLQVPKPSFIAGGLEAQMFALLPAVRMDLYPFALALLVFDPKYSPRHEMFELWLDRGVDLIGAILTGKPLPPGDGVTLTFFFPERWMCPQEQRIFLSQLKSHPDVARVNEVRIVTQCPLIMCNARSEQIGVYELMDSSSI